MLYSVSQKEVREPVVELSQEKLQFTGNARSYFRIWIVNIFLTIVTLGIFSAWAKVRRKQYFSATTLLRNSAFEYTGDPWMILRGRVIAYGLVLAIALTRWIEMRGYVVLMILLGLALPYLYWSSARFNARNTRWRGIPFNFHGSLRGAYTVWLLLPLAIPFTLGLLFPYVVYRQQKYLVSNHSLGDTNFTYRAESSGGHYKALVLPVVVFFLYFAGLVYVGLKHPKWLLSIPPDWRTTYTLVSVYAPFFLAYTFWRAGTANLLAGNLGLSSAFATSHVKSWRLLWLYFSGFVASIFSAGLLTPWATTRIYRYRIDSLLLHGVDALDEVKGGVSAAAHAAGQEISDAFDFGLEFGL